MNYKPVIKQISYYKPKVEVCNDFFINHYDEKYKKSISRLLESTGRDIRYHGNEEETILSMSVESTKKALEKSNLKVEDIDMIVFSTGTPEYIQPCNAIKLHNMLGCKKDVMLYDLNTSCVGMVVALTQVFGVMKTNPNIKHAIVVGAEQLHTYSHDGVEVPFSILGESACTVVLENVPDNTDRGMIGYGYRTDSSSHDTILLPAIGMKKALLNKADCEQDTLLKWNAFGTEATHGFASDDIEDLLNKHGIGKKQVKQYFLSQLTKTGNDMIANQLGESTDKFKFVGDKFGYTGTTSPFIALAESINNGEVEKGDIIVLWSVGSGFTFHTSVLKL